MNVADAEAAIDAARSLTTAGESHAASGALAHIFAWTRDALRFREIRQTSVRLEVARGFFGYEPAAVFATGAKQNGGDLLDAAALYAYHASTRWGVVADHRGITVFNSHWLADDQWFRLPQIHWDELKGDAQIRDALSPLGVAEGRIDQLATRRKPPSDVLHPVDDELVQRLDAWRDEALRHAHRDEGVDEQLQILFAQFFVLRTVEDRHLDATIPPIESALVSPNVASLKRLRAIFNLARDQSVANSLIRTQPGVYLPMS